MHQRQNPKNLREVPPNKEVSSKSIKGNTKKKANTKIKEKSPHNNKNKSCTKTPKHHHKLPKKQPPTFCCSHTTLKQQRQKATQQPTTFEKSAGNKTSNHTINSPKHLHPKTHLPKKRKKRPKTPITLYNKKIVPQNYSHKTPYG